MQANDFIEVDLGSSDWCAVLASGNDSIRERTFREIPNDDFSSSE